MRSVKYFAPAIQFDSNHIEPVSIFFAKRFKCGRPISYCCRSLCISKCVVVCRKIVTAGKCCSLQLMVGKCVAEYAVRGLQRVVRFVFGILHSVCIVYLAHHDHIHRTNTAAAFVGRLEIYCC